jgi:hypothetical protein
MQHGLYTAPCLLHWHLGTAAAQLQCMYPCYHYFVCILYVVQRRLQYTLPALTVFCSTENILLAAQNQIEHDTSTTQNFHIIFCTTPFWKNHKMPMPTMSEPTDDTGELTGQCFPDVNKNGQVYLNMKPGSRGPEVLRNRKFLVGRKNYSSTCRPTSLKEAFIMSHSPKLGLSSTRNLVVSSHYLAKPQKNGALLPWRRLQVSL